MIDRAIIILVFIANLTAVGQCIDKLLRHAPRQRFWTAMLIINAVFAVMMIGAYRKLKKLETLEQFGKDLDDEGL